MRTVDVQKIDPPVGESTQRLLARRADKRRTVGVPSIALRHGLEHLLAVEAGLKIALQGIDRAGARPREV